MSATRDLSRYRYIARLGAGGMARVDLAEDTLLGRQVALKRVIGAGDERAVSRLRREALTGASLSHPNLVSIYDVVTSDDGELIIVMEYVPGQTLRAALDQGRLPVDESLRIVDGVAAGLDAIHEQGIVHRDVKPSNILLGEDGAVKLADLGIAAVPDRTRITTSGSILGSLSYMAPEQLEDTPSTPAVDVYALAAVAFEMLSGQKARREANAVALAHAMATQPPPDLRQVWAGAPPAAAELLMRAMSRDPAGRPRSAGELARGLRTALTDEPTRRLAPVPVPAASDRSRGRAFVPPPAPARPAPARADPARAVPAPAAASRSRRSALAGVLLALVAAVVALIVILTTGGSAPRTAAHSAQTAAAHRHHPASSQTSSASHSATAAASATSTASSSASAPAPASSSSSSNTGTSTGTSTGTTGGTGAAAAPPASPSPSPAAGAGNPVSAVESFYEAAAAHRYAQAWALADPTLRAQLDGYRSFTAQQSGTQSITFNSARTVSQSSAGATVAVQTTSVRTDGTHHCTGTVDVVPNGSAWLVHLVHINCTQ